MRPGRDTGCSGGVVRPLQIHRANGRTRGARQRICVRWMIRRECQTVLMSILLAAVACSRTLADEPSVKPVSMARIGEVDERFQSYNVEMVEVTGGRFWKPYGPNTSSAGSDLFAYRPPINLASPRLRKLAAALAPAYVRVSGTWANATYFADSDHRAIDATFRIRRRSDPPAMARRGRFLASGWRTDRHLLRRQSGHPRCRRAPGHPIRHPACSLTPLRSEAASLPLNS